MTPTALVRLDESALTLASVWQDAILSADLESRPNYTGLHRPNRFLIGYLGELAVARLLEQWGVIYVHRVNLTGKTSASEFLARMVGRNVSLEVKTAGDPTHQRLMFPAAQHDHSADFLIAARVEALEPFQADVSVWGYLTGEQAHSLPVGEFGLGVATRHCRLTELNPIADLLNTLDRVRRVDRAA